MERDKAKLYDNVVRGRRPLAPRRAEKTTKIGNFVLIEQKGARFHIEVDPGVTLKAAKRVAHILWNHARTHKNAKLNQHINGRERTFGKIRKLSIRKIISIIMTGRHEKAQYVVISEHTGGALSSDFWLHPGLSTVFEQQ